jgi:anti-sigma factor (TIGR02949 family)
MSGDGLNCREALELLQDYLHREATPELAQQIERHLEHCAPCLRHARFEENFQALLGATAAEIRCPDTLRKRVLEALRLFGDEG